MFGTNPRGSFSAWEPQTVFVNPGKCELRARLLGDGQVLKEAQNLMIERLARLDRDTVKTIFRVSRFNKMDQKQLRRLRASGACGSGNDQPLNHRPGFVLCARPQGRPRRLTTNGSQTLGC